MATTEVFLTGDDGKLTVDDVELESLVDVSRNSERTVIESRARGDDNVNNRLGKRNQTLTINIRVEPSDTALASLLSAHEDNETVELEFWTDKLDDSDFSANFHVASTPQEQPLEEAQTYAIEVVYASAVTAT